MVWHEDALKHLVHLHPDEVFGRRVQIINLDTKNTPHGRADIVLLDAHNNLIVCELKQKLDGARDVQDALIKQAWAYAGYLHWNASYSNLVALYRNYYYQYCDATGHAPLLSEQLGAPALDPGNWAPKVIVAVAAWRVADQVYTIAEELAKKQAVADGAHAFPCEVWVMEIPGQRTGDMGPIGLGRMTARKVFETDRVGSAGHTGSVTPTGQHSWASSLGRQFHGMKPLLQEHLPSGLQDSLLLLTESRFREDFVKFMPWGLKAYVCFEAWGCDLNPRTHRPHFQLYVGKRKDINQDVSEAIRSQWGAIADQIGCPELDLERQGVAYPIKQYNADFLGPQAIARGFGRFVSAVYPVVREYVW